MQEKLRSWISPPDPSVNHITASKTQRGGTAKWFIQGSTFQDWKKNGSLLWIRGNRMLPSPFLPSYLLSYSPISQRAQERASCGTCFLACLSYGIYIFDKHGYS